MQQSVKAAVHKISSIPEKIRQTIYRSFLFESRRKNWLVGKFVLTDLRLLSCLCCRKKESGSSDLKDFNMPRCKEGTTME